MLWGGLHPIRSRLYLDSIALLALGCATYSEIAYWSIFLLVVASVVTFSTSGLTERWTISLSLIPIVFVQTIRLSCLDASLLEVRNDGIKYNWTWIAKLLIQTISAILIAVSAALTILFPAVEISKPNGKYNVGVIDLHLPVKFNSSEHHLHSLDAISKGEKGNTMDGFVSARLLYPTLDPVSPIPHFNKDTATEICRNFVTRASPVSESLYWILDYWKLSNIQATRNAQPIGGTFGNDNNNVEVCNKFPVVVYSHGILGSATVYSYQCMNLASNGSLVIAIDHTDGSSVGMRKQDGRFIDYDTSLLPLFKEDKVKYACGRRKQADHRSSEMHAVTLFLRQLNRENLPELDKIGISFTNKIDICKIAIGGHSFGGATALTTATRYPELYSCVIAHDPMCDWMTDDTRKIMFKESKFEGSHLEYNGGTGCLGGDHDTDKEQINTFQIHDLDILFLFSHQWKKDGSGHYHYISDMVRRGEIGPKNNNLTECVFIQNAHHTAFSDLEMKIPLWLGRSTGTTGKRNPHEAAEEIASRTSDFVNEVLKKKVTKPSLK